MALDRFQEDELIKDHAIQAIAASTLNRSVSRAEWMSGGTKPYPSCGHRSPSLLAEVIGFLRSTLAWMSDCCNDPWI